MAVISIKPTYGYFTELDGSALDNGSIYIGTANLNPITNPVTVYWDFAQTIPASQPIKTIAGNPARDGTAARIYYNGNYSMTVVNSRLDTVYSALTHDEDIGIAVAASDVVNTPAGNIPETNQQAVNNGLDVRITANETGKAALAGATFTGLINQAKGADIASATTVDLTAATGNLVHITGTTATTGFTMNAGQKMVLIADAAWPLTYNATTMNLNGGISQICAAGDRLYVEYDGTTTYVTIVNQDGTSVVSSITLDTPVASTSGTSIDFTGVPSTAKRVKIMLSGVSTNGTSQMLFQVGDGAIVTTGYLGTTSSIFAIVATSNITNGFGVRNGAAAETYRGSVVFDLLDAANNIWIADGQLSGSDASSFLTCGEITLVGAMDRVRLTTQNGTDAFDAGSVNVSWE